MIENLKEVLRSGFSLNAIGPPLNSVCQVRGSPAGSDARSQRAAEFSHGSCGEYLSTEVPDKILRSAMIAAQHGNSESKRFIDHGSPPIVPTGEDEEVASSQNGHGGIVG